MFRFKVRRSQAVYYYVVFKFKKQADAIKLYCVKKIKLNFFFFYCMYIFVGFLFIVGKLLMIDLLFLLQSHLQNVVGVCGRVKDFFFPLIKATRDIPKIMNAKIYGYLL